MTQAESGTDTPRGPVFVGGTGRSGTTIIGELIGASAPYALVPIETRFQVESAGLVDLANGRVGFDEFTDAMQNRWFYREPGASGPRGLHVIITREALDEALERLQRDLDEEPWQASGQFLQDVLDPVATQAGKATWVEMTPPNAQWMSDLARMLPDAKFVNMVRDGRDVASSIVRRWWGPNDFPGALKRWSNELIATEKAIQDTDPQRVLTLRLESFIGPPRKHAYRRLADFLSMADDAAMREFFDARLSSEEAHQHRWTAGLEESQITQYQSLYERHLQRLADAGAGLPKPGLESVPGEIDMPDTVTRPATKPASAAKQNRKRISVQRQAFFDAALRTFEPGRLIDLGAGHGGYSRLAADAGWEVTAVDARDTRFPKDERITWVRQDVREVDLSGYDLILCLGLFYHLTLDDQLDLLKRTSGTPLILDTHVATDQPTHELSGPIEDRGYSGRYYSEEGWQTRATAAWNNTHSFWPTPDSLYRMLADHGYPAVFAGTPWVTTDRTFFLCTPDPTYTSPERGAADSEPAYTVSRMNQAFEHDAERAFVRQGWQFVDTIERLGSREARKHFRTTWDAERARAHSSFQPLTTGNLCTPNHKRIYEGESNLTRFRRTRDYVAPGERVFDIGLGRGYLPGILLRDGELAAYHGIDPDTINVKATRQMFELNGLADHGTAAVGDLYELTREEVAQFGTDLVVCCEVIEHVPDAEKAVQALANALPEGAELLLSVPLLGELEVVWGHVNFFDMARARAMVENAGLTVHHVDAVDNIWTFILASNDPAPSPRAARAAAAPVDVTANAAGTPDMPRGFHEIDLTNVGVKPSSWQKRLTSSNVAVVNGGVDFEGVAKGRGPIDVRSTSMSYTGISFPVHDVDGLRLELTVREAEQVKAIFVDFYANKDRIGRWKWDNDRIPIEPSKKVHVLRPGRRSPTFRRLSARDLPSATSAEVFVQLEPGGSVKMRLNRAAKIR